jgi:flagellar basal-body rod protein FlgB
VTTPGYRRVEVSFEGELKKALDTTRLQGMKTDGDHLQLGRKDISRVKPRAYRPNDPTLPSGVNNVDIDMEMSKLAENQLMYNLGLKFVRGHYAKMNAAVQARSIR